MSLILKSVSLVNFKNYETVRLDFSKKVNCFTGENGAGKTNLLDAIYYLCMSKSYFNTIDSQNIFHGRKFFRIEGEFESGDSKEFITCIVEEEKRKEFLRNKKKYGKLSEHIGLLPVVVIAPDDVSLIIGGSEERRKFMDSMIAQLDKNYLENLLIYNKVLTQRNATLRNFAERNSYDESLLQGWNNQLTEPGIHIFEKRKEIMKDFLPLFQKYYLAVSEEKETVSGEYKSDLQENSFADLLKMNLQKDRVLERTNAGVHKDDMLFTMNGFSLKKFGSQGQMKSFLIALKLAEFELLKNKKSGKPLLLLDDISDKLDNSRLNHLIDLILQDDFGQIFITDSDKTRMENILKKKEVPFKLFLVENGKI